MRKLLPLALLAAPIALYSCSGGSFKKNKNGLLYKIVKDQKGTNAVMGDKMELLISARVINGKGGRDSILGKKKGVPDSASLPTPFAQYKGHWFEGLTMLSKGDSAVFRESIDSIYKREGQQLDAWLKPGAFVQYEVRVLNVTPDLAMREQMKSQQAQMEQAQQYMEQMKKQQQQQGGQPQQQAAPPAAAVDPNQPAIDDKKLQEYFTANKLKPKKTASGLYYIIDNPGSGPAVETGKTVQVNYTGKFLNGESFDSNEDPKFGHVEPLEFPAGQHQVIPGWDEGVMLVKKGGKVRLFIPSTLAYGPQGRGPIEPNSILTFNVSVTDVK